MSSLAEINTFLDVKQAPAASIELPEFPAELPTDFRARLQLFKDAVTSLADSLEEAFDNGLDAANLVHGRALGVDVILRAAWRAFIPDPDAPLALIAVGGYGRGELHPGSDVDIQLLTAKRTERIHQDALQNFTTFLWDIGLEPGQSVRTVNDCVEQARNDITVMTNLLEARLLTGSEKLYAKMQKALAPSKRFWPADQFFAAKLEEQQQRHSRQQNAGYRLEPNVKESAGGLRDLQMIGWVAKRHFGKNDLADLVGDDFLTEEEYSQLITCQHFLWRVRFGLHLIAGRSEDRLLFDLQMKLTERLGYRGQHRNNAIESFMQQYYRTVMRLSRLNEMLLQLFEEKLLLKADKGKATELNSRFQIRNGFLGVTHPQVFEQRPLALLEVFHLMQQHPELKGVNAATIRLIRENRDRIDDDFRDDIRARSLFIEMFRQGSRLTHELRRMNRYGVLARYIPAFGRIVGRMQFDLFHAYTVDEHILMVVRNLRHSACGLFDDENPFVSELSQNSIPKLELLYLAGLFHDIAKGRGGDHSELGEVDAREFCSQHGLSDYDAGLVGWLVGNHLLMSMVAQRKDISDPEVINDFAAKVGSEVRLNYLFLLTVADIQGTNPELWNSWRQSLLMELYRNTLRLLKRGLDQPMNSVELISDTQIAAMHSLIRMGYRAAQIQRIWNRIGDDYFLRHNPEECAWHADVLLKRGIEDDSPLVALEQFTSRGGLTVFIFMPDREFLFGYTTAVLNRLALDIVDARIYSTSDGYTMNSYVVLEQDGSNITEPDRLEQIQAALQAANNRFLNQAKDSVPTLSVSQPTPRILKAFHTPTKLSFEVDVTGQHTRLQLTAADRPGLLSVIGRVFAEQNIVIHAAKVATIGERAEDVFTISTRNGNHLLSDERQQALAAALTAALQA